MQRGLHQAWACHLQAAAALGNLQGLVGGADQAAQTDPVQRHQQPHRSWSGRSGDARADLAEAFQAAFVEAAHQDTLALVVLVQQGAELFFHADVRHLDLHHLGPLREARQHLGEGRDADALATVGVTLAAIGAPAVAGVQRLHFGQAQLGHLAAAVGGAVNARVVQHHELAVASAAHVHFQHVHIERIGAFEGEQGVLRPEASAAPVGDYQRLVVEAGEHRGALRRAAVQGQRQQGDGQEEKGCEKETGKALHVVLIRKTLTGVPNQTRGL
ncbi:hypothetical protein D9M68_595580 [compost metagenome]